MRDGDMFKDQIDAKNAITTCLNTFSSLQDDDIANLRNSENGKGRVDDVRDRNVALAMYHQELRHMHQALSERSTRLDHQVADRIIAPLSDAMVERDTPVRGRLPTASSSNDSESDFDTETYAKEPNEEYSIDDDPGAIRLSDGGSTGYVNDREEDDHVVAESSHYAAPRAPTPRPRIRNCVACLDRRGYSENMAMAACGHWYCLACLTGLFESALKDDSLSPPRCCRRDQLQPSKMSLGKDLYERFQKKFSWNEKSLRAPAEQADALYPRNALPEADEPEIDPGRRLEWIQNKLRTMNADFARANRLVPAEQRDAGHPRNIVPEAYEPRVDPVRAAL
ncbi:MAG: hypothetical protein Q9203_005612 [Teloschistes exilis]